MVTTQSGKPTPSCRRDYMDYMKKRFSTSCLMEVSFSLSHLLQVETSFLRTEVENVLQDGECAHYRLTLPSKDKTQSLHVGSKLINEHNLMFYYKINLSIKKKHHR